MGSFDIDSLLRFSPAQYLCEKCCALWLKVPVDFNRNVVECMTCGVEYTASQPYAVMRESRLYFDDVARKIQFKDTIAHSRRLAGIAQSMRYREKDTSFPYLPMRGLMEALDAAQQFVHFVTYGMSLQMVGTLRMAALRVPVRGVVSNANSDIVKEFKQFADESPKLDVHVIERSDRRDDWSTIPHHKIIIIDGLLAFKGSANLTVDGWRKAANGLDSVEPVTDVNEVIALNNRQFSPIWARDKTVSEIFIGEDLPF